MIDLRLQAEVISKLSHKGAVVAYVDGAAMATQVIWLCGNINSCPTAHHCAGLVGAERGVMKLWCLTRENLK